MPSSAATDRGQKNELVPARGEKRRGRIRAGGDASAPDYPGNRSDREGNRIEAPVPRFQRPDGNLACLRKDLLTGTTATAEWTVTPKAGSGLRIGFTKKK